MAWWFSRKKARLEQAPSAPDPMFTWGVEFEEGGRVYTYTRTKTGMQKELSDRYKIRGEMPYRVTVVIDGEVRDVKLNLS